MEWNDVREFLERRVGVLEGVCITGGEPTLHKGLKDVLKEIKALGFLTKLDTNGTRPEVLVDLVETCMVDYVALDVKNSPAKYGQTVGIENYDLAPVIESIEFLLQDTVDYEFRTTVVEEFHDQRSLTELAAWIKGAKRYYLQSFVDGDDVLRLGLHPFSLEEMKEFERMLKPIVPSVQLRGA